MADWFNGWWVDWLDLHVCPSIARSDPLCNFSDSRSKRIHVKEAQAIYIPESDRRIQLHLVFEYICPQGPTLLRGSSSHSRAVLAPIPKCPRRVLIWILAS